MTVPAQPAIREPVPKAARYRLFMPAGGPADRATLAASQRRLAGVDDGQAVVAGIGPSRVATRDLHQLGL